MTEMTLTSTSFEDGERIPDEHGYSVENTNPRLEISGVPEEAGSLALIVDDPDAREPAGKIWDHWLVWNVDPARTTIPENWEPTDAVEGRNDFGERGWGGPEPPDGEHTYRFLLYALDEELELDPDADKDDLYDAAQGRVVEKANLEGTYAP